MGNKASGGKKGRKIGRTLSSPARSRRVSNRPDLRRKARNVALNVRMAGPTEAKEAVRKWADDAKERPQRTEAARQSQFREAVRARDLTLKWIDTWR